jgi:hypothetical protein
MDSQTAEDIKRHLDIAVGGLRVEIQDVKRHSDVIAEELRAEIQDVKRHSDVIAEALRSDIRTVAEGFVATNERLDRLEVRISEGFEELKSTIRLSYVDLDRRVVVLEKRPPS